MAEKMPPKPVKNVVKSPAVMKQVKAVQAAKKLPQYAAAKEITSGRSQIREKSGSTKTTLRGRMADAASDRAFTMGMAEAGASGQKKARAIAASTDPKSPFQSARLDKLAKAKSDLKTLTKARKIEEGRAARIEKAASPRQPGTVAKPKPPRTMRVPSGLPGTEKFASRAVDASLSRAMGKSGQWSDDPAVNNARIAKENDAAKRMEAATKKLAQKSKTPIRGGDMRGLFMGGGGTSKNK